MHIQYHIIKIIQNMCKPQCLGYALKDIEFLEQYKMYTNIKNTTTQIMKQLSNGLQKTSKIISVQTLFK